MCGVSRLQPGETHIQGVENLEVFTGEDNGVVKFTGVNSRVVELIGIYTERPCNSHMFVLIDNVVIVFR